MRILIVDDDPGHGESLADLLATRGHETFFAASPGEAEWLCGLFRFDLSVIDFEMPHQDGVEVAAHLRERAPDIEVAIVSAQGESALRRGALGKLPFFPKPIDAKLFLDFVDRLVLRRSGAPLVVRDRYPLQRYQDR